MKEAALDEGVCSRPCDLGGDCAPGILCISVELSERDERGNPVSGGYCVPRAVVEKKKNESAHDVGTNADATDDGWLPIPRVAGQFEGELVVKVDLGEPHPVWIKGSLARLPGTEKKRTVVDAAHARMFVIDDDKKTFAAQAIEGSAGDVLVDKSTDKDTVVGIPCDIFRVREGHSVTEACVMQRGAFADPRPHVSFPPWQRELAARGAIPLRALRKDSTGKEIGRFVVVSVGEKPMDAGLFGIPKTYRNLAQKK